MELTDRDLEECVPMLMLTRIIIQLYKGACHDSIWHLKLAHLCGDVSRWAGDGNPTARTYDGFVVNASNALRVGRKAYKRYQVAHTFAAKCQFELHVRNEDPFMMHHPLPHHSDGNVYAPQWDRLRWLGISRPVNNGLIHSETLQFDLE